MGASKSANFLVQKKKLADASGALLFRECTYCSFIVSCKVALIFVHKYTFINSKLKKRSRLLFILSLALDRRSSRSSSSNGE